jgi:hypothetical protein
MSAPKRPLSPSLSSSLAESSRLRPLPPAKSKSKGSRQSSGFKRAGQTSTPTPTILKTRIRHLDQGSKGVSGRITTSSYPVEVSPLSFGVLPDDGDSVWIDEAYTNVAGEMASEPSMKKTSKATKARRKAQYKVYLLNTYLNIMLTIDDALPFCPAYYVPVLNMLPVTRGLSDMHCSNARAPTVLPDPGAYKIVITGSV